MRSDAELSVPEIHKIAPRKFAELNKEWWLLLGLLLIAALLNYFAAFNQMLLGLYTLPTLFSAYLFGRRHAILTAFASVFTAIIVLTIQGLLTTSEGFNWVSGGRWYEITVWGGILVVTAYAMGTLFRELREVYRTLHLALQYQMKNGFFIENSVFRTTEYVRNIAEYMRLSSEQIEDLRRAATLLELAKHIDLEILEKTARIALRSSVANGNNSAHRNGEDPLPRVARLLEAYKTEQSTGAKPSLGPALAQAAGILRLANEYAEMTTDSSQRKALSPVVARNLIARSSLSKGNPQLMDAFADAFQSGKLETAPLIIIQKLRRYSRVPMVIPVEIATEKRTFRACTEMLGGGGMSVVTPERLELSEYVRVSFELPRLGSLLLRASVVWVRNNDGRIGLAFDPGQEQRSVDEWIQSLFRDLLTQVLTSNTVIKPATPAAKTTAAK